jgi:small subunit ribosomal protein S20
MPKTKSAKRAYKKSEKKRKINLFHKERIKALFKELKTLVKEGKVEEGQKLLPQIYKALDKAAKRGVIKKGKAARKKSQAAKMVSLILKKE